MSTDLSAFKGNALVKSDAFQRMMELNKKLSGGGGGIPRISIRGSRFREMIGGEQVRVNSSGSMNVVVLGASAIGRTYFEGEYKEGESAPPTCWSADGDTPSRDVPAKQRKSTACRDCKMNIKGSGQGDSRACRFHARIAVAIEGQLDKVYQMQLPATSLFGEAKDGKMGMQSYVKFLSANDMAITALVTQIYFDEDQTAPKLYFKPVRPLDEDELDLALDMMEHEDVQTAITMTVHVKEEEGDADDGEEEEEEKPAPKKKPKPAPVEEEEEEEEEEEKEVEEPTRKAKSKPKDAPKGDSLDSVLSAWDD